MQNDLLTSLRLYISNNGKDALDDIKNTGNFIYTNTDYTPECEVLMICLNLGYHKKLLSSNNQEIASIKKDIADLLINESLDINICNRTVDILEAALFKTEEPAEKKSEPETAQDEINNKKQLITEKETEIKEEKIEQNIVQHNDPEIYQQKQDNYINPKKGKRKRKVIFFAIISVILLIVIIGITNYNSGDSEPPVDVSTPQPIPAPDPEPAPQPKPAPEPEPAPQPKPAPEPEPAPQPKPAPEPAPQPKPAPQPAPAPQPKPAPEPAPAPQPKPAPEPAPAPLPELTGTVRINGTPQAGETLTANTNNLGGSGNITYQWRRGNSNVGSNRNTYNLSDLDVDSTITVTVTRSGNSGSFTSSPTPKIQRRAPSVLTGTVRIDGTPQVGQKLTANTDNLDGDGEIIYEWLRDNIKVGTNSKTYSVKPTDAKSTISVRVSRSGYSGSVTAQPEKIDPMPPPTY